MLCSYPDQAYLLAPREDREQGPLTEPTDTMSLCYFPPPGPALTVRLGHTLEQRLPSRQDLHFFASTGTAQEVFAGFLFASTAAASQHAVRSN